MKIELGEFYFQTFSGRVTHRSTPQAFFACAPRQVVAMDPVPWNGGTWPMSGISEPGLHDCLIGRGGKC